MHWVVPWTLDEVIDFVFLVVSTIIVTAVPMVYGSRANLRDPMARALLAATGVTAAAFIITVVFTVAVHGGWSPPDQTVHWLARAIYLTVAVGKFTFLLMILAERRVSRNRQKVEGSA